MCVWHTPLCTHVWCLFMHVQRPKVDIKCCYCSSPYCLFVYLFLFKTESLTELRTHLLRPDWQATEPQDPSIFPPPALGLQVCWAPAPSPGPHVCTAGTLFSILFMEFVYFHDCLPQQTKEDRIQVVSLCPFRAMLCTMWRISSGCCSNPSSHLRGEGGGAALKHLT